MLTNITSANSPAVPKLHPPWCNHHRSTNVKEEKWKQMHGTLLAVRIDVTYCWSQNISLKVRSKADTQTSTPKAA
jgi:hypothetical protein